MNDFPDSPRPKPDLRADLALIADLVTPDSKVLDIGCDDGALLDYLVKNKRVDGRGMELSQSGVNDCIARGLFVVQGDADLDLKDYPDASFDYAVLSRTLQAVHRPKDVLLQLLRIGKKAIITIPNFGHWKVRRSLIFRGRMPVTKHLDRTWYNTDNIHFCTINDIMDLLKDEGITMETFVPFTAEGKRLNMSPRRANWSAAQAMFVLSKK